MRLLAVLLLSSLALAGCQTSSDWGKIAVGVGSVIGQTQIDPQIEKVSSKLARYCEEAQVVTLAVSLLAPARVQKAAEEARVVVATYCAAPPSSVSTAISAVGNAITAIQVAKQST